ncbi:hypothetical protein CSB93_5061 [Pseudomonas paraeruginosa]|uniref:Uncharacterized protein n=1 Tax=Pseudomonas paraeruginosa TaxID=2994495 RepID=A0A2R3J156_9PSED|nr:hypothetical protein CSB93_5061 [Pseudomonas paraeruginosa]PTC36087.1 hypothetical protein CLJ1_3572 [Pseudomonas aeruginosa]
MLGDGLIVAHGPSKQVKHLPLHRRKCLSHEGFVNAFTRKNR